MKIQKRTAMVLLALMIVMSGAAYAEMVQGEVTNVDLEGKAIELQKKADPAAGLAAEQLKVTVSDTTAYSGEVTALEEIIEGDVVKMEADKDASGNWVAKSVDVSLGQEE